MSVKPMAGFDMDNRDPNNLNEHLQVYMMSPISELQIFIYDDSYIGQSAPACCRAPAGLLSYMYMSLHI